MISCEMFAIQSSFIRSSLFCFPQPPNMNDDRVVITEGFLPPHLIVQAFLAYNSVRVFQQIANVAKLSRFELDDFAVFHQFKFLFV
ncbi:hypothetical protein UQ64_22900 [Paenibacillus etheri]|uniref:Uncharacterized protein n=1 Tax=Paenibacillus etheri TaxID=1306852 RepID=A0A0W1AT69_9BACL|nr:hypothetical protein UQ64_22900 [Paenibacillus etheri]